MQRTDASRTPGEQGQETSGKRPDLERKEECSERMQAERRVYNRQNAKGRNELSETRQSRHEALRNARSSVEVQRQQPRKMPQQRGLRSTDRNAGATERPHNKGQEQRFKPQLLGRRRVKQQCQKESETNGTPVGAGKNQPSSRARQGRSVKQQPQKCGSESINHSTTGGGETKDWRTNTNQRATRRD